VSGSQPFPVSDLARGTNPTISKRITVLATSNGFVVVWAEGTSTSTSAPVKARCFSSTGTPLSTVQTLSGPSGFIADQVRYSAVVYGSGTKLALYYTWYGQKKLYFATYTISASGGISVATSAKQVANNPKPETREIRQDYLQAYESGSTTTFMVLVEDFEADYAQSTLSVSILDGQVSSILGFTEIGGTRAYPGAMVTLISDKYVVLWNDPGNVEFSAIKGRTYNPQTGAAGGIFDFWITSNTTDMAMDLIPINSKSLLFGHTRMINRPVSQMCYQVVSWDGTNIPQTVSSDKMMCIEGAFGSPETSAVVWENGQVTTFWTNSALSGSVTQMSQVFGLVDMNELGLAPISAPASAPSSETPSASPDIPTPAVETPSSAPSNDESLVPSEGLTPVENEDGVIAGVVVSVGAVLGGGTLLLVLMLKRRKNKQKTAELTDVRVLTTDNDDGKYISLPSAVAIHNYAIPKQKIQLKQQIASGSFGAVYAAAYNNTPVAVKVHQSNMLSTDDFLNEANLALSIKPHPNVLVTLGITQLDENTIGLVMEYCAGGSLWSQIKDHPPQSKQQVLDMLVSIASGLEHLHSNGIIHRDVAARNVLITAEGHLKLADFGMSRKLKEGDGSKTNQTIGPAASMAPESIRNGTYSKKSDVWMFGIMIYEILSGKKPHGSAENLVSVAIDIRETGRIPTLDEHVDDFFKQLMHKCCQFEPDQRPDFEQIIQELNDEKQKMNEQS
jgi:predicted Ser/Thr protein kinase